MDVFETVKTVLAIRKYQSKPIPQDIVHEIVKSARLTASSQNGQPWHFIVVQDHDTLQKLASVDRTGPYITQAPLAIVVSLEESKFTVSDGSRAIQSMILTAWSHGIGSNWTGFLNLEAVKPILGIPENQQVLAVVPFGYPAQPAGKGKKNRKPLSQVASLNRYDQPYSG